MRQWRILLREDCCERDDAKKGLVAYAENRFASPRAREHGKARAGVQSMRESAEVICLRPHRPLLDRGQPSRRGHFTTAKTTQALPHPYSSIFLPTSASSTSRALFSVSLVALALQALTTSNTSPNIFPKP